MLEQILRYGRALGGKYIQTQPDEVVRRERAAMERLAAVPLPTLGALSLKDIVAARDGAEGFQRWRESLREGLLRIESGSPDDEVMNMAVAESLAEGKNALEAEIDKSSLLNATKTRTTQFAIGALAPVVGGAVVGAPPGTLVGGLAIGSAQAVLNVLHDFFAGAKDQVHRRALLRHYALWTLGEEQ
jgi:hypothetical protein